MDIKNTGRGVAAPEDADERLEINISVEKGLISTAGFSCTEDKYLRDCAETLCRIIKDKPFYDIMQMNNKAIYYNCESDLPRGELYKASIAVLAAKKAVADYCKKNGLACDGICDCI